MAKKLGKQYIDGPQPKICGPVYPDPYVTVVAPMAITTQWLQIAGNSLPDDPPMGCLDSIFTVRINSKSFFCAVHSAQGTYFPHFRQRPMSDIG